MYTFILIIVLILLIGFGLFMYYQLEDGTIQSNNPICNLYEPCMYCLENLDENEYCGKDNIYDREECIDIVNFCKPKKI